MLLEQTLEELEDEGMNILTVANGEEGLAIIKAEHPNLVFLDVMIPKIKGERCWGRHLYDQTI